jgi:phage tail sheath protein FI
MVQVSYPGVYIKEVPSGSRTITGVSTSITAFVGVTKRGPVGEPVAVLSYSDYVRNFSDDTQVSEMTDQVRQFFLNGGQQAYVLRIAATATNASVDLGGGLALSARSAGDDGKDLRVKIDYNTAEPDRTFNVTIYRESVSVTGVGQPTQTEELKGLSMDPTSPRYVVTVVNRDSTLCTASITAAPVARNGASVGGRLLPVTLGATYGAAAVAAVRLARNLGASASFEGRFRITVGSTTGVVSVNETSLATLATIQTAVNAVVTGVTVSFTTQSGLNAITFASATGNRDVRLEPVPDSSLDIANILGLGTAQGGLELGAYAESRPLANGIISQLGLSTAANLSDDLTSLLQLAGTATPTVAASPATATKFSLDGPASKFSFVFPTSKQLTGWGTIIGQAAVNGPVTLNNVAAFVGQIASAINAETSNRGWQASVAGLRLVLSATFGTSASGPGHSFSVAPATTWFIGDDGLFPTTQTSNPAQALALALQGGDISLTGLNATHYDAAFAVLDSKVDLFNLLVLPRTFGQDKDVRADVWANASAFCDINRAFLIIDPTGNAVEGHSSIDNALQAVKENRLGIVKDHSAMYWPRVAIKPESVKRYVDPAGTIAGLMARIDGSRGVWKAPAGTEADLRGVFGVETPMSDRENGRLNPEALNCIRAFTSGIISWGARTMDGYDNSGNDDYKYVPVRRFALFLEESLYRGLQWAVFEPNDQRLWSQIRMTVSSFMNGLFRQGAFFGETSKDAYFVKVDAETTTPNDINLGICNVIVGFAPVKPAEFIVVTIKQKAGQVQV